MANLLRKCIFASRLGSKAISKSLPFEILSSKTFVSNPNTLFWTTSIRYSFSRRYISPKDQRYQNKYAQEFLTVYESLKTAVSKLQALLKSLRQQEDQLDTTFLERSQEKPKQQVVEIIELVKTLKSQTIELEKSMSKGVQLMHENKINKRLLQILSLMQKKRQQRASLAQKILTLASKLSKDNVDPKLMRIFEYLGGVKQQAQIRDSLTMAYISTSAINKMDAIGTNKDNKNSKYFAYTQQVAVLIGIFGLAVGYYYYISNSQDYQQKALAKKHRNTVPVKEDAYLEGSKVEDEIKGIIDTFTKDQVKMIVASPGVGKTTALKKILTERKETSEFFYFTFQSVDKQADCDKAASNLLSSLYGIQAMYGDSTEKDKKIKIIIDDINRIEKLTDPGLARRIMTLIYAFAWSKSLDLICISSSGTFIEDLQLDSQHIKSVQTFIIQSEHSQEFINSFFVTKLQQAYLGSSKKRLDRSQTFWSNFRAISKQVFDYGFTPRFIEYTLCNTICDMIKQMENSGASQKLGLQEKEQNQLKEILKMVQKRKNAQNSKSNKLISGFNPSNKKNYKEVLRQMNSQRQFDVDNCLLIGKNIPLINNMIDYLNNHNLIMFCRPRTKKERAAFEQYINDQSEESKGGNQK